MEKPDPGRARAVVAFHAESARRMIAACTAIRTISSGAMLGNALRSGCFLIADVRGCTLFTQERGDEAAAKLAAKFAPIPRDGVEARGSENRAWMAIEHDLVKDAVGSP